jgi:hypothetical protein
MQQTMSSQIPMLHSRVIDILIIFQVTILFYSMTLVDPDNNRLVPIDHVEKIDAKNYLDFSFFTSYIRHCHVIGSFSITKS